MEVTLDCQFEADDLHEYLADVRQAALDAYAHEVAWQKESERRRIERMFAPPKLRTYDEVCLHLTLLESSRDMVQTWRKVLIAELGRPSPLFGMLAQRGLVEGGDPT